MHNKIGLSFIESKSEMSVFDPCSKQLSTVSVQLSNQVCTISSTITQLGLPIGSNLKLTRLALIQHSSEKSCRTYGLLIGSTLFFNRFLLARLYNVFVMRHNASLSSFWPILSEGIKELSVFITINIAITFLISHFEPEIQE